MKFWGQLGKVSPKRKQVSRDKGSENKEQLEAEVGTSVGDTGYRVL